MDNESGSFAVLIVAGLPMMLYGKHYSRWSDDSVMLWRVMIGGEMT